MLKIWQGVGVSGIHNHRSIWGENCRTLQFKLGARNEKSCLWWSVNFVLVTWLILRRVETEEIVLTDGYMCTLAFFLGAGGKAESGGGCRAIGIAIGVYVARAGAWRTGSSDGSRMGYLPWLISCRLLWLNPGALREHLTSQLSCAAAWLLVTCISLVYQPVD